MATYYVSSVDGSNSDDGTTWALAVATLEYAVETLAATGGPHTILVDSAHSESLSADTTITAAQDLRIISVNRSGSDAPLAGALIGAQATNYSITLAGARQVFVSGITFRTGTNTSATEALIMGATDGMDYEFEGCTFNLSANNNANSYVAFGATVTSTFNSFVRLRDCTVRFSNVLQSAYFFARGEAINLTIDSAGTTPNAGISPSSAGCNWWFEGCNLTKASGTLVGNAAGGGTAELSFSSCSIASGVTVLATATTILHEAQTTVYLFNCSSGDEHWHFGHFNPLGSTVAQTSIYANDGAKYDGTNGVSWLITTTANANFYTPYSSPWIDTYAAAGTVTPSVEIVRSGSATAYQNDEVWPEFSYQGTSGSTKATIVSGRTAVWPLSPSNLATGDLDGSGWTGENATSWFGKLSPGEITIAEIGHLRARIVVGEPSITVYADPTIRT